MRLPIKEACLAAVGLLLASCNNGPLITNLATIHYTQQGACTTYQSPSGETITSAPYGIIVVFRIASIDNTASAIPFSFEPQRLYETNAFVDINTLLQQVLFNAGQAQLAVTVPAQQVLTNQSTKGLVTLAVAALAFNSGLTEAAHTSYNLWYNKQPNDPSIVMIKDNGNTGSWPTATECEGVGAPSS